MKSMYIGSGDVTKLLSNKKSKGFEELCKKFFGLTQRRHNAFASPIDALRTGAILEERYYLTLPEGYYPQYKVVSKEMDVLSSSLDFAKIEERKVVDFEELKTIFSVDFLMLQDYKDKPYEVYRKFIKKTFKSNYNQFQQQLYTTELEEATLVYLEVQSYDDTLNRTRDIKEEEVIKFRLGRDEEVISQIKERARFFQDIKDYFK